MGDLNKYVQNYKSKIDKIFSELDIDVLENAINELISVFQNDGTVYVCGNGGSASTASHMQADFSFFVRYFTEFRPKVKSLCDNSEVITAISNDISFENIFVEQLKGNIKKSDLLIIFSASGNSLNLINAVDYVQNLGIKTIGFIGFDGGKLYDKLDYKIFTQNPKGDYGPIEDFHLICNHIMVNYLVNNKKFLAIR